MRNRDWLLNSLTGLVVFVLATLGRLYAGPYLSHAFFLDRNFTSRWTNDLTLLAITWGWDFFAALVAGLVFFLLVRGQRALRWVATLALALTLFKLRFYREWISPEADWISYIEDYGVYFMPLVGVLAGAYLAKTARTIQHSRRGA